MSCYPLDDSCIQVQRGSSGVQTNWVFSSSTWWQWADSDGPCSCLAAQGCTVVVPSPSCPCSLWGLASFRGTVTGFSIASKLVLCSLLIWKGVLNDSVSPVYMKKETGLTVLWKPQSAVWMNFMVDEYNQDRYWHCLLVWGPNKNFNPSQKILNCYVNKSC